MRVSQKSILLIDDDAAMLRALEKVLTAEGAKVTAVKGIEEALNLLPDAHGPTDLVITDLRMPGGGKKLLQTLMQALPRVPVMVMTAVGNSGIESECRSQGVAAFLEKPLDTSQLLAAIASVSAGTTLPCGEVMPVAFVSDKSPPNLSRSSRN